MIIKCAGRENSELSNTSTMRGDRMPVAFLDAVVSPGMAYSAWGHAAVDLESPGAELVPADCCRAGGCGHGSRPHKDRSSHQPSCQDVLVKGTAGSQ